MNQCLLKYISFLVDILHIHMLRITFLLSILQLHVTSNTNFLDFPPQYDEATMPPAIEEVVPTSSGTSSDEVSSTTTTTTTQSEIVNETQSTTNIEVKVDEQAEMVPTSTDSNK